MNTQRCMHAPRTERGVATIEFAICAPLLLLLLLATAEVGRVLFQYNTLTKAVRDGVRYTAAYASDGRRMVTITPELRTQTRNLVVTGTIAGTGAALLPGWVADDNITVADADNGFVLVAATYTYRPMLGASLPTFGLGDPIALAIPLTATVVMRAL